MIFIFDAVSSGIYTLNVFFLDKDAFLCEMLHVLRTKIIIFGKESKIHARMAKLRCRWVKAESL
jgi:hypothetical protein